MEGAVAIDYEHTCRGAHCVGLISEQGQRVEALWECDFDGVAATRVQPMLRTTLVELWHDIMASLASCGVFWRNLVNDPTRPLDPEAEHLIVATVRSGARQHCLTFAVPADEAAPEFTAWLAKLAVPSPPVLAVAAE